MERLNIDWTPPCYVSKMSILFQFPLALVAKKKLRLPFKIITIKNWQSGGHLSMSSTMTAYNKKNPVPLNTFSVLGWTPDCCVWYNAVISRRLAATHGQLVITVWTWLTDNNNFIYVRQAALAKLRARGTRPRMFLPPGFCLSSSPSTGLTILCYGFKHECLDLDPLTSFIREGKQSLEF